MFSKASNDPGRSPFSEPDAGVTVWYGTDFNSRDFLHPIGRWMPGEPPPAQRVVPVSIEEVRLTYDEMYAEYGRK